MLITKQVDKFLLNVLEKGRKINFLLDYCSELNQAFSSMIEPKDFVTSETSTTKRNY